MLCCTFQSKNTPMSIFAYDLDGDGVKEMITGWSNGKVRYKWSVSFNSNYTVA